MTTDTKRCPKVILEGTRLTHKTDLALALNRHPRVVGPRRCEYPSPLVSAEWCGFSNHPWGYSLINYGPEDEARAMETYATWARLFELLPYYSWIVDRFHLSTRAEQRRLRGVDPGSRLAGGSAQAARLPDRALRAPGRDVCRRPGGAPGGLRQAGPVR